MKITRILKRYAGMSLCLCLLGAGVTGCIKDDDVAGQKETTLTLTVSTRADDPTQNDQEGHNLETNEEMKTLRVIVARQDGNEIIYNWYEDNIADNDFQRTINFSELTIETTGETFDFYAIANEVSLDLSQAGITSLAGKDVNLTALKSCIINRNYNVLTAGNIPQTAFESVSVVPGTSDDFTMQLEFVVAKVRVNFVNETGEAQTLSNIRMEGVKPNQGYLFNDKVDGIYVPANTTYTNLTIADGLTVPAGENDNTRSVSAYLYPSNLGHSFVLEARWNNHDYALQEGNNGNITSGSLVTGLDRSQLLDITVTLKKSAVEVSLAIKYEVKEWATADIEVPSFN